MPFFQKPPAQQWSQRMDALFVAEVDNEISKDDRTFNKHGHRHPLGYPFSVIREKVLRSGRTNFSEGYEHDVEEEKLAPLTPDDKVLLYCSLNFRGHYHSSLEHFKSVKQQLLDEFLVDKPVVIDIGCGPATSALALAELFPNKPFDYIGIDSAKAMRQRGAALLSDAKQCRIMHSDCEISFLTNWNSIPIAKNATVLFNFAFFFASETLDEITLRSLANCVRRVAIARKSRTVFISYTNAIHAFSNRNYVSFLNLTEIVPVEGRADTIVHYLNRRGDPSSRKKQDYSFEFYPAIFS
jgi:hypothetical protein